MRTSGNSLQKRLSATFLACFLSHANVTEARPHPIRSSGEIRSVYSESKSLDFGSSASNWTNIATIKANSYIWHPWFALISGSLNLSNSQANADNLPQTESEAVGGALQFKLFPTSRFPFLFFASESHFEQDGSFSNSTFSQRTLGMRQTYHSLDNKQRYVASYQRQTRNASGNSSADSEVFSLGASHRITNHNFASSIDHSESFKAGEENLRNSSLQVSHSYSGSKTLSLKNQLSASESSNDFSSATSELSSQQFSSSASWAPPDNRKLRVNGNFRLNSRQQTIARSVLLADQFKSNVDTANLNQGLVYQISDNLNFTQSLNINDTRTAGSKETSASESAALDYASDAIEMRLGSYSWFAGGSISNQHGNNTSSTQSLGSQLGQNLSGQLVFTPDFFLTTNLAQNVGYNKTSKGDSSGSLGHSASLGWTGQSATTSTAARASFSDSRSLTDNEFTTQILDTSLEHDFRYDRFTNISAEMKYQKSRSSSANSQGGSSGFETLRTQVAYSNNKLMNIAGLNFKSTLGLRRGSSKAAQQSLSTSSDDSQSTSWSNDLIYRVGLFESRISLDYIKNRTTENRTIIIQLTRKFGDI